MSITAPTAERFCSIIGGNNIAGYWYGSAFRKHPRGIIRERMLFTNEWHVHNYCSVKVITDQNARVIMGCKDPAAYGNPHPTVDRGELVTVYRNGSWIADGPWCARIVAILNDAEKEIAELKKKTSAKQQQLDEQAKLKAQASLDAARAAFSTTTDQ